MNLMEAKAKVVAAALRVAANGQAETYEDPGRSNADAQAELEIFEGAIDEYIAISNQGVGKIMKQFFTIKDSEGQVRGEVFMEDYSSIDSFDFALTPIVNIEKDAAPVISGFLASLRTTVDTRPREKEFPHRHLGHQPVAHGTLPDHDETVELSQKGLIDA